MTKFLIFINDDKGCGVAKKIRDTYTNGNSYQVRDNLWWVKSEKPSNEISQELGFGLATGDGNMPPSGMVVREENTNGYFNKDFWEWYSAS